MERNKSIISRLTLCALTFCLSLPVVFMPGSVAFAQIFVQGGTLCQARFAPAGDIANGIWVDVPGPRKMNCDITIPPPISDTIIESINQCDIIISSTDERIGLPFNVWDPSLGAVVQVCREIN